MLRLTLSIRLLALAVLAVTLAACGQGRDAGHASITRHITVQGERVGANAPGGDVAWIDAAGDIRIDGQDLALDENQRRLAREYHQQAFALREDGIAIGKSGAALGLSAIGEVASGLASGEPERIGERIEGEAREIEARARQLCGSLGELRQTQDALARALPAFERFATIDEKTVRDCKA